MSNKKRNRKEAQDVVASSRKEVSVSAEYHHSGPIPDPHTLEKYEQILPGAADRIIKMAESQSDHRKEMERVVIKSGARDNIWGIISGLLIAITTILTGAYVIVQDYVWSGTFLGSAGLIGVVGVFIYGTRSSRKEREGRRP